MAALACVYLFWGSAFVALRYVVQVVHPALVAGLRYVIAGTVLILVLLLRGQPIRISRPDAYRVMLLGFIMFTCNTVLLSYGGRVVTAGMAAMIISTIPVFIGLLETALPGGNPLRWPVIAGMLLGSVGIALLLGITRNEPMPATTKLAILALLMAAFAWAVGTVMLRRIHFSAPPLVCVAWQMLLGGAVNIAIGIANDGWNRSSFHTGALGAILYLSLLGTLVGYTSYTYLLQNVSAATATTYAYVNPIVAVVLGWALLHEHLLAHEWLGMAVILFAVALILLTSTKSARQTAPPVPEETTA